MPGAGAPAPALGTSSQVAAGGAAGTGATDRAAAADRVLGLAIDHLRAFQTGQGPAVETRLDHPELGPVRLLVAGRIGERVQAELVAADPAAARALVHAVERFGAGAGLSGIDVRVRAEGSAFGEGRWSGPGDGSSQGRGERREPDAFAAGQGSADTGASRRQSGEPGPRPDTSARPSPPPAPPTGTARNAPRGAALPAVPASMPRAAWVDVRA
ncbi:MAG TPA: hypothetical protein VF763_02855 [Candidatus Limnocylindrales bacterium]